MKCNVDDDGVLCPPPSQGALGQLTYSLGMCTASTVLTYGIFQPSRNIGSLVSLSLFADWRIDRAEYGRSSAGDRKGDRLSDRQAVWKTGRTVDRQSGRQAV